MSKHSHWQQCNSFSTYHQLLLLQKLRNIFGHIYTRNNVEISDARIMFMSLFIDIERTKRGNTGTCVQMPKKWQLLRPTLSQDSGASWDPRQKIRGGTEVSTNLKEHEILSHCRCLAFSSVTLTTRHFQQPSHYRLDGFEERRKKLPFPRNIRKEIFRQYHIGEQSTMYVQLDLPAT